MFVTYLFSVLHFWLQNSTWWDFKDFPQYLQVLIGFFSMEFFPKTSLGLIFLLLGKSIPCLIAAFLIAAPVTLYILPMKVPWL